MIKRQNILCMPLTTWHSSLPNTVVKMMTLLSKENKILFVDYQYTFKDLISSRRKPPVQKILGLEERLTKVTTSIGTGVHVLTPPPVFPINWIKDYRSYKVLMNMNASIVKGSIQAAVKMLEMDNLIVINGYNSFFGLPLAGAFNEMLNVYYCYDEIKGDQWYNHHGPRVEEEYMRKADLVIATSDALHASKCTVNNNCFVVKNGVDFGLFNQAASFQKPESADKVIGYTGSLDERFDIDTMSYLVENLPGVQFEFVGRITNEKAGRRLSHYPNVKLLGERNAEEVPEFLKKMDVCIIPYLKNDVTRGVYPLKINEYLAAGKPVVMTDFAPLPEFEGMVGIASSKEKFLALVKDELSSDSASKKQARIEMAKKNSWENRVEELSEVIEKYVNEKSVVNA